MRWILGLLWTAFRVLIAPVSKTATASLLLEDVRRELVRIGTGEDVRIEIKEWNIYAGGRHADSAPVHGYGIKVFLRATGGSRELRALLAGSVEIPRGRQGAYPYPEADVIASATRLVRELKRRASALTEEQFVACLHSLGFKERKS